ncbi:NAD(P)/FAD-dependent oxidoreductase [Synechococcus sp. RedBA-s]|uniref:NAD(P)/FAD-dependent oxidoreductase n=1 Tax=Synechococcus sp. RedBA-s TaxID=2823741 RepID=UPI0020CCF1EB|nr:FAD-dependent oxidoreductase [Synechococcus sp. RedBA-s]MCP9800727.1 FAD-dependent monooxygenase [Synechococcus sp. RedBA-s]
MEARHLDADVIVVGGGPGGASAAIACATRGLKVCLLERSRKAEERPGETLHPGVEPLLSQLGVGDRLESVVGARHPGIWVDWGKQRRFVAFGGDAVGPWSGYQVRRAEFDALLLARAAEVGVVIKRPCAVTGVCPSDGRRHGVLTSAGPLTARMLVDATGRARALCRMRGLACPAYSSRLVANYGYVGGSCPVRDDAPALVGDAFGWTWTAMVRPGLYQWTRLSFSGPIDPYWMPEEFQGLPILRRTRGVDVSWRMPSRVAHDGWFLVGDAAATLDPASSHGVLRSIMSGMMAGHLIGAVLAGTAPESEAARAYHDWVAQWFQADLARMKTFYADLGVSVLAGPDSAHE